MSGTPEHHHPPRYDNHIAGAAVPPRSGRWDTVNDPSTGRAAYLAPRSDAADVDEAVRAATSAFGHWRWQPPARRAAALLALADAVAGQTTALAEAEAAMTGKSARLVAADEIAPAVDHLRFFAGAARLALAPAAGEYEAGLTSLVRREPVGVSAQILPWNFPLLTAVWKLAPALAAGNCVVLKPAPSTPVTALRLADLADAHLPPGVVNVVCGDAETGRLLAVHPDVAMVSLTGSTRAGREVAAAAGDRLKRIHLELGGNAPVVVLADADLTEAVDAVATSGFGNAGQDCVAAARVIVAAERHDEFVAALVKRAESLRVGPPGDDCDLGPLHNAAQLDRLTSLLFALTPGARIHTGGRRIGETGYFFEPTVVSGVRQHDRLVQEETFGPVVTVQPFDDLETALDLANGVEQGLAASVWTRDHGTAMELVRRLEFGCVWINTHLRFASEMPHGGFGVSGHGKELSIYALDEYSRIKHAMTVSGAPR